MVSNRSRDNDTVVKLAGEIPSGLAARHHPADNGHLIIAILSAFRLVIGEQDHERASRARAANASFL